MLYTTNEEPRRPVRLGGRSWTRSNSVAVHVGANRHTSAVGYDDLDTMIEKLRKAETVPYLGRAGDIRDENGPLSGGQR